MIGYRYFYSKEHAKNFLSVLFLQLHYSFHFVILRSIKPVPIVATHVKEDLLMLKKILKKFEDMNSNTITQDMLVGDIVRLHPEVVDTLLSHGMHCLGCPSSQQESLANACMVHGLDPEKIVTAVNLAIQTEKQ